MSAGAVHGPSLSPTNPRPRFRRWNISPARGKRPPGAAPRIQHWPVQLARITALTANSAKPNTKNSNVALIVISHQQIVAAANASVSSTANAKGAGWCLDFNVTLVLGARTESECAACAVDNHAAGTFVWFIDKLVESDL